MTGVAEMARAREAEDSFAAPFLPWPLLGSRATAALIPYMVAAVA